MKNRDKGAKIREKLAGWAIQLKAEVVEKAGKLKSADQKTYNKLVDETVARLVQVQRVGAADAARIAEDLKIGWAEIAKRAK